VIDIRVRKREQIIFGATRRKEERNAMKIAM